ncbi:permease-like cell division protein FtsX [Isachenkonia alkalipeptolytica]|uniref:Cell division protein FtsX n=1 Tax=Isachenkonia alkalipeptolytica TaxID=2565777 RepID=A0AA43XJA3_9CLOT|nr:permease-like cell division protein FtsX [Isachenkonia alkalipeptolytica]NBG87351.1 ABC transporter permease [Isachenkonia alkalipeptolytica]
MKIKTMGYMTKQGLLGLWRNRGMSIASIGSVTASLLVLGVIITLVINMNNIALMGQSQFDNIQVYLEEELENEKIDSIGTELESIQGVANVEYESQDDALDKMKESWGEQGYLLDTLENNPLPNSYIVYFQELEASQAVVRNIQGISGVDEVRYYQDVIDNLVNIADFVQVAGLFLIVILGLIAVFIISNTIKLTLNARRQEITIMKYVGATNWFIRWPFVIEGIFLGLIGSLIALTVVYFGYEYIYNLVYTRFYALFAEYIVSADAMLQQISLVFVVLGIGVGILGSLISMRKHLKV